MQRKGGIWVHRQSPWRHKPYIVNHIKCVSQQISTLLLDYLIEDFVGFNSKIFFSDSLIIF